MRARQNHSFQLFWFARSFEQIRTFEQIRFQTDLEPLVLRLHETKERVCYRRERLQGRPINLPAEPVIVDAHNIAHLSV